MQLIDGVRSLHEQGLIHRDLKPENILIVLNKEHSCVNKIKIIDLGLAIYKYNLNNMPKK